MDVVEVVDALPQEFDHLAGHRVALMIWVPGVEEVGDPQEAVFYVVSGSERVQTTQDGEEPG